MLQTVSKPDYQPRVFLNPYVDFCIDGENVSVVISSIQSYTYYTDDRIHGFKPVATSRT